MGVRGLGLPSPLSTLYDASTQGATLQPTQQHTKEAQASAACAFRESAMLHARAATYCSSIQVQSGVRCESSPCRNGQLASATQNASVLLLRPDRNWQQGAVHQLV